MLLAVRVLPAYACGYCVEDKIAAVYDHAIVTGAATQSHQVAFFAIDGPVPPDAAARSAIQRAIAGSRGMDAGSTRVSLDSGSLSFAFDPRRIKLAFVQRELERRLSAYRLSLMPLRVMDKPAELKAVSAR